MPPKFITRRRIAVRRRIQVNSRYKGKGRPGTTGAMKSKENFSRYAKKDPFPPRFKCKLHYSETFTFTTGAGGVFGTEQAMRLNSLVDANLTGVGHQPYCFDQLGGLYGRYLVTDVEFQITWSDPSADGMVVGALLQGNSSAAAITSMTPDRLSELPFSAVQDINNSGGQKTTMHKRISIATLMGLKRSQIFNELDLYGAAVASTPAVNPYVRFSAASSRGNTGDTILGKIDMIFNCIFYDRITQAQS